MTEHWPVFLLKDVLSDLYDEIRPDTQDVVVVCSVMDCAK
jgi:hypothetical protein